jgi:plastocyanin
MDRIRKYLGAALAVAVAAVTLAPGRLAAQVSGRVRVTESGGRAATDLGDAVVYIEGRGPRGAASSRPEMALDARQFRPRVLIVPVGTTVQFPNLDPFNHNVFSGGATAFDLGLYGRGESRNRRFTQAGLVRVFCNIHPRMVGHIVVRDNAWYAQPGADGSFAIPAVPPGSYTLKVWHERALELTRAITVPAGGLALAEPLALDASGYRFVQHKDKNGREYGSGAARERY